MTPIPIELIDLGVRSRTEYPNIDELAESIADSGLIQPLVLVRKTPELISAYEAEFGSVLDAEKPYLLTAGGRRYHALLLLNPETILWHGSTSDVEKPGYILRDEASTFVSHLIIETKENLDRADLDWRDELTAIVRAWRVARRTADENAETLTMRDFGSMLGCGYARLEIAEKIFDHFIANPDQYSDAASINGALAVFIKCTANEVARVAVTKSMSQPMIEVSGVAGVTARVLPERPSNPLLPGASPLMEQVSADHKILLSQSFFNVNGIDFTEAQPPGFCDHVICDPDYAIDPGVLDSNPNNREGLMRSGVAQTSVDESLRDLFRFIPLAFRAIREQGFFIFWYSIDYQETLRDRCLAAGFAVQRWPNIWNKTDFRGRSNAAPNHNFPKSVEWAMVCRKPGTILRKVQTSNVYSSGGDSVTKALNHPYAKPYELWRWLYSAVAVPGQTVWDPFVGSGSSAIAAITYGLRPLGAEINPDIYNHLIINLQNHYRKLLGPQVTFA